MSDIVNEQPRIPKEAKQAMEYLAGRSRAYYDDHPNWLEPDSCEEIPEAWRGDMVEYLSKSVAPSSMTEIGANIRTLASFGFVTVKEMQEVDANSSHTLRVAMSSKRGSFTEWYDSAGRLVRQNQDTLWQEIGYDEEGYLTKIRQWQYGGFGHVDEFEYGDQDGQKMPVKMTRRLFTGLGGNRPSDVLGPPIEIDLQKGEFLSYKSRPELPEIDKVSFEEPFSEVRQRDSYSGIVCVSADDLIQVLYAFSGAREAFNADVDSRSISSGGAESAHIFEGFQSNPEGIKRNIRHILEHVTGEVPNILKEVGKGSRFDRPLSGPKVEGNEYQFYFDYDGFGGFHKSGIRVEKLDNGGYVIALSQGPRGNEAEKPIAEELSLRRRLTGATLTPEFDLHDGMYAVDIADALRKVMGDTEKGIEASAAGLVQVVKQKRDFNITLPLSETEELYVRLQMPTDYEKLTEPKGSQPVGIKFDGACFWGYPVVDWDDETRVSKPSLTLTVRAIDGQLLSEEGEGSLKRLRDEMKDRLESK